MHCFAYTNDLQDEYVFPQYPRETRLKKEHR
ncbi:Protein of unknown function [Pyronema omphalodes CBS 100304]|uniref:Uncharacterized protein n=1 Tax=Pyronema omphalodes (strain CBS 100304) TaxID=1076935 RepID=U4L5G9_PYROM|nr:Protein of unknown function [Pyronema omphalodes CBS 100304]